MHSSDDAERRFAEVFAHVAAVRAYAARRGCPEPEEIAAEALGIAWRRLEDVPTGDPRPWLFATARNLVYADWRGRQRLLQADSDVELLEADPEPETDIDPALGEALRSLSASDREALLLVAWDDLTPTQAARSLGITPVAFRVRLHRARTRCRRVLDAQPSPADRPASALSTTSSEPS